MLSSERQTPSGESNVDGVRGETRLTLGSCQSAGSCLQSSEQTFFGQVDGLAILRLLFIGKGADKPQKPGESAFAAKKLHLDRNQILSGARLFDGVSGFLFDL